MFKILAQTPLVENDQINYLFYFNCQHITLQIYNIIKLLSMMNLFGEKGWLFLRKKSLNHRYLTGLKYHCVKSVRIRSHSGPYFPAFGLNTERYSVFLRMQSECGKIRTTINPNTDTFYVVYTSGMFPPCYIFYRFTFFFFLTMIAFTDEKVFDE